MWLSGRKVGVSAAPRRPDSRRGEWGAADDQESAVMLFEAPEGTDCEPFTVLVACTVKV